jgi:hypothetical protein
MATTNQNRDRPEPRASAHANVRMATTNQNRDRLPFTRSVKGQGADPQSTIDNHQSTIHAILFSTSKSK